METPKLDMVRCSDCGWEGKCEDAIGDWEQPTVDGMSVGNAYEVHFCPKCDNDEMLEDYFYSRELSEKIMTEVAEDEPYDEIDNMLTEW